MPSGSPAHPERGVDRARNNKTRFRADIVQRLQMNLPILEILDFIEKHMRYLIQLFNSPQFLWFTRLTLHLGRRAS